MLERPLGKLFRRLGFLIHDHCLFFIIIPLALVCCLSAGLVMLLFKPPQQHPRIFSPDNGPAYVERELITRYWPFDQNDYYPLKNYEPILLTDVVVAAKGHGNILDWTYRRDLTKLMEEISQLYVADENGKRYKYKDLCLTYKGKCYENNQVELLSQHNPRSQLYNISYPFAIADGRLEYIGNIYGGASFDNQTGYLAGLKAVRFIFFVKQEPEQVYRLGHEWLKVVQNYLRLKTKNSDRVEHGLFSKMTVCDVTADTSAKISKRIPSAVLMVFVFSFFATLTFFKVDSEIAGRWPIVVDWSSSKIPFGFLGVVVSGMGIASGIGLVVLTHMVDYSAILVVVPFLILGIGMDDTFIMISSWSKNSHAESVRERIAATMEDSAVSITITTLTNVLSFGIGASSPFPAIRIFCVNTGLALLFAFLYQITFFAACLVVGGSREAKHQHCCACMQVIDPVTTRHKGIVPYLLMSGTVDSETNPEKRKYKSIRLLKGSMTRYGNVLLTKTGIIVALSIFAAYLSVSIYGFYRMKVGLNPPRLVPKYHPAKVWYSINERYFWKKGERVDIFITNPPQLHDQTERGKFLDFVASLEDTKYILNKSFTALWLREYLNFLSDIQLGTGSQNDTNVDLINRPETWKTDLCRWLSETKRIGVHPPVVWKASRSCADMAAFRFTVGIRDFIGASGQAHATANIRALVAARPEYKAVSYNFMWQFMDQYIVVEPDTLKSAMVALVGSLVGQLIIQIWCICVFGVAEFISADIVDLKLFLVVMGSKVMMVVAALFLPNLPCALLVGVSVISVTLGVVGGYHYWDVSLDFVSMVNIILSIGFAVDLTAHIAHAFLVDCGEATERAKRALRYVGSPVLQGALSTIVAMFTLSLASDDYVVLVFFKTMFLVVVSGFLHAVVFLPVLMTLLTRLRDRICSRVHIFPVHVQPEISLGGV